MVVICWVPFNAVRTSGTSFFPDKPRGMTKSNTAFSGVPELVTAALLPGSPEVTLPTAIVAAAPGAPVDPDGPVAPVAPVGPLGPVGPDGPVAPVGPVGPVGPDGPVAPVGPVGAMIKGKWL